MHVVMEEEHGDQELEKLRSSSDLWLQNSLTLGKSWNFFQL